MSKKFTYFGSFASWAYLIDLFPSITMAFDFRKLRSAYSGNAIKVLRTSDNTEQDFPFVANEVVGSDVLDFVGYNLFAWSEQLQQPYWAKTNLTVTTDTLVAPDGLTTGDVLFETITNGAHNVLRTLNVTAGKEYTVSFWVKSNGRDFIRITVTPSLSTNIAIAPIAWFNLSTGTVVSENGMFRTTPTITPAANGWFLITYGLVANSTANVVPFQLNTSTDGSTTAFVGDTAKGVGIWGSQISETPDLKPYRQTLGIAEGVGSISKGYDQATGGDDMINSTIIRQPIIVNNGNLITDGGKLALQGGSSLGLRSTGTVALSAYSELFFTFGVNVNNVATEQILFESAMVGSVNGALQISINSGKIQVLQRVSVGVFSSKSYPISNGRQLITVRFRTGQSAFDASQVWINGVEVTGTVTGNNPSVTLSNQVLYLFARNANTIGFLGKYQNFTMFTDSTQRIGIETNINNYYGYY